MRSVNLAELTTGSGGKAQVDSRYKRLQRFFRSFEIDPDSWARLRVRLVPAGDGPWRLTLDRTHWKFGAVDINFLVLGIAYRGIALPVSWNVLGKAGNCNTTERMALMERFLAVFSVARIAVLLADREFVGEAWFRWLQAQRIPFHQRIKRDTPVPDHWNRMTRVDALLGSIEPGPAYLLPGRRPVWGCFVHLSALRLDDGERLIIATSGAPQHQAIDAYVDRWQIEIDQPYNLHKSSLLAMRGIALGPRGGAPRLELFQFLGVGVDQPERTGGMGDLAAPQSAAPQPGEQGWLRHVQAVGQLGEGPLGEATVGNRRRRGRAAQPQADLEVTDRGGVEGFAAFGRMPALGVQLRGHRRGAMPRRMQHRHPGRQLGIVAELVEASDRPDQGRLGTVATEPVNLRVDPLALTMHRDHHPFDPLPHDGLAIRRGGGRGVPERRDLGGQPPDRRPLLGGEDGRLLGLEAGMVRPQGRFGGQGFLPLAFQGAGDQPALGFDRLVLAGGPFDLVLRSFQALLPMPVQVPPLGLQIVGHPQADLPGSPAPAPATPGRSPTHPARGRPATGSAAPRSPRPFGYSHTAAGRRCCCTLDESLNDGEILFIGHTAAGRRCCCTPPPSASRSARR